MKGKMYSSFCFLMLVSVVYGHGSKMNVVEAYQRISACILNDKIITPKLQKCYKDKFESIPAPESSQATTADTIKGVCAIVDPTSCLKQHVLISECVGPELQPHVQEALDVFSAGYRYACADDGAKIQQFIDTKGPGCVVSAFQNLGIQGDVRECINKVAKTAEEEVKAAEDDKDKVEAVGCKILLKYIDCFFDYANCDNNEPKEIVEGLVRAMMKETPCWKHYPSSSNTLAREMYIFVLTTMLAIWVSY